MFCEAHKVVAEISFLGCLKKVLIVTTHILKFTEVFATKYVLPQSLTTFPSDIKVFAF